MINIGQSIHDEMVRQERTVSWLARKLNCTRVSVYRILSKNSIDTRVLESISRALHHDFFIDLSESMNRTEGNEANG